MLPGRVKGKGGGATPGPLLLDASIRDRLVAKARAGIPINVSWRAEGLSPSSWGEWVHAARYGVFSNGSPVTPDNLAIIEDFVDRYERARAQYKEDLIGNIYRAGFVQNPSTGMFDWRAHQWLLQHGQDSRQDWYQHRPEQTVKVKEADDQKRPSLRDKTDDELLDLVEDGGRWRQLLGGGDANPTP